MKNKKIKIGNKFIGGGSPCLLIAEVGTTALGDLKKALKLIKAAAQAGVDAVKFQLIDPDQISDKSVTYPVISGNVKKNVNMYKMFKDLSFSIQDWKIIKKTCEKNKLLFFTTVDFIAGVDLLEKIGVCTHKIGAWDTTYSPLIQRIGKTKKPMFVDLGPTTEVEIKKLVALYTKNGGTAVLFMHDFHTQDDREMNLRAIQKLNRMYPWPAGFSSPGLDDSIDVAALALGSACLEKRLTLNRKIRSFHAHESLEPLEMREWVKKIRHVERALGKAVIHPSKNDLKGKKLYYRSICTVQKIKKGQIFSYSNIDGKRPGTGISTMCIPEIIGRKAQKNLKANHILKKSDFK